MRLKICGIKTPDDARYCCEQGAWALGFNFYVNSPRYVSDASAKALIEAIPASVLKVGLSVGESYERLARRFDTLGLDLMQVYAPIKNAPRAFKARVILALQAEDVHELPSSEILNEYGYILLDAAKSTDNLLGGTGRLANWQLAKRLAKDYCLILAGGITALNARQAMAMVNPYALDSASGVECAPGHKDKTKINQLLKVCAS